MAEKLVKYLDYVKDKFSAVDKARVVMKTGFSDSKAASEPDSPDNINKIRAAIKDVTMKDAPTY